MVTIDFDDVSLQKYVQLIIHIIIVVYTNGVGYRGSSEMSQIHVLGSHFSRLLDTVYFDDGSFKKYGQFII